MSALWVSDYTICEWKLNRPCEVFQQKYDGVQKQILDISCMDDFLSGKHVSVSVGSYVYQSFAEATMTPPVDQGAEVAGLLLFGMGLV